MKKLKIVLLPLAMVSAFFCRGEQFNIPNGDISALKAAIIASNTNNKPDTIHLAPFGMYRFTTADNDYLASGANALPPLEIDVSDANPVVIYGNGATFMRDPSIDVLRLLYVGDVKLTVYDLNFIGGTTLLNDNEGGAIMINSAKVTLENCLLKNNRATNGGAVYLVARGTFTAKNCTFTGNVASAGTGSAFASTYGNSYFQNCVIAYNRCVNVNVPAAIYNFIPLNSNTVLDNIFLKNSIVAKNTYDNPTSPDNGKEFDMAGAVYSDGGNVIGSYPVVMQVSFPTFRQGTPGAYNDYVGTETVYVDPLLGILGDHGLFTDFYPLLAGSPALNNNAGIKNAGVPMVASNGIIPAEAYPAEIITMTGINLQGINRVQFAGAPTTVTGITTTNRTLQVPVHANARTGQILLIDPTPRFIFTIQKFKVKTTVTPLAPTNLVGAAESTSSIKLTWSDVPNEDDYQIEYKKVTDNVYTAAGRTNQNVTNFTVENLLCTTSYNFRIIARGHGTLSLPSNTVQLAPLQLQPVTVTPPLSSTGCAGGLITLTAPAAYDGYLWNTGETTQAIDVTNSGNYSVQVTDAANCTSSPSLPVTLTFYTYPDTTVIQTGNDLSTPVIADHYQWYRDGSPLTNETTNSLLVTRSGVYKLELGNHGCASVSREVTFELPASPSFVTSTTSVCSGASSISYSVSPISNATYIWTFSGTGLIIATGAGTNAITADFSPTATSGVLSVSVEVFGFRSPASEIMINVSDAPSPFTTITGDAILIDGSTGNTYRVNDPGGMTFNWSYDGEGATLTENGNFVTIDLESGATAGVLSVIIGNDCGNAVIETFLDVQHSITSIDEKISDKLSIYPSPSDGKFTVNVPGDIGKYKITISDLTGHTIYKAVGRETTQIDLDGVGSGYYVVTIEAGEAKLARKIKIK